MRLYRLDPDSFGDRIKGKKIKRFDEDDKDEGYVLFSPTEDLTSFVKSQLKDPSFFDKEPMDHLRKNRSAEERRNRTVEQRHPADVLKAVADAER